MPKKSSTPNETCCGSQFQKGCSYVVQNTRLPRRMFRAANIQLFYRLYNKTYKITLSFEGEKIKTLTQRYILCAIASADTPSHHRDF